jgi:hypothetical protein
MPEQQVAAYECHRLDEYISDHRNLDDAGKYAA